MANKDAGRGPSVEIRYHRMTPEVIRNIAPTYETLLRAALEASESPAQREYLEKALEKHLTSTPEPGMM